MKATFDHTTCVLDYGPQSAPLRYAPGRRSMLWPALAYKVVVPVPRERPFNLFQEYVLKLCRAGETSARQIGARLALGEDLVGVILTQLQNIGLLDGSVRLTRRAKEQLDDLIVNTEELTVGHVFQDPFQANLWPRFLAGPLKRVTVENSFVSKETRIPHFKFDLGTPGNPKPILARAIEPVIGWEDRIQSPSASAVLAACRTHRKQQRNYERICGRIDNGLFVDTPPAADQVALISDEPLPVFLSTFLFVPENIEQASLWQVCDPFGLGPSPALRQRIEELLDHSPGAALRLVLDEVARGAYDVNPVDLSELIAMQQQAASQDVERRFGADIGRHPELLRRLIEVETSLAELRPHTDSSGTGYQLHQTALKDVYSRLQAALEELLHIAVRQNPPGDIVEALSIIPEDNAALFGKLAEKAGFRDDAGEPCFRHVFYLAPSTARGVREHGNRELWAQFAVLLTGAQDLPDHPLTPLAASFPDAIAFLYKLKQQRIAGVHATGTDLTRHIDPMLEGFNRFMRTLVPGVMFDKSEPTEVGSSTEQSRMAHRIRAGACFAVERRLGLGVRERPMIQGPLIEMQAKLEEARHLTAESAALTPRLTSFLLKGCIAIEAGLKLLLLGGVRSMPKRGILGDKNQNARLFTEIAREVGFSVDGELLPAVLVKVKSEKIVRAIKDGDESINPLVLALLLSARNAPDHPFRFIVKSRPSFLLELAELSKRRGHGDVASVRLQEADLISEQVFGLIEEILKALP